MSDESLKERAAKFLLDRIVSVPTPGCFTDFSDEITTLMADFACIVALPIVRERVELMKALKSAKGTIRNWHDMRHVQPSAWAIYERNAPEMKVINAALALENEIATTEVEE